MQISKRAVAGFRAIGVICAVMVVVGGVMFAALQTQNTEYTLRATLTPDASVSANNSSEISSLNVVFSGVTVQS